MPFLCRNTVKIHWEIYFILMANIFRCLVLLSRTVPGISLLFQWLTFWTSAALMPGQSHCCRYIIFQGSIFCSENHVSPFSGNYFSPLAAHCFLLSRHIVNWPSTAFWLNFYYFAFFKYFFSNFFFPFFIIFLHMPAADIPLSPPLGGFF
jgi:hypothetical protein